MPMYDDLPTKAASILAELGRILCSRPLKREEIAVVSDSIQEVGPWDIADAIHTLVDDGIVIDLLKPAVSRLVNLVSKPLERVQLFPDDPFFKSLILENVTLKVELDRLRPLVAMLHGIEPPSKSLLEAIGTSVDTLREIDLHYKKKENVLFPYFESRYPRYRCISLMWALHDDVRATLSEIGRILHAAVDQTLPVAPKELAALIGRLFFDAFALAFREEKILFPIVAELLTDSEKDALFAESRSIGFSFLRAEEVAAIEERASKLPRDEIPSARRNADESIKLDAGALSLPVLDSILKNLSIDLTFVDAADRVAYFTNGPERVFMRSTSIIGRDVRNCHPPKSLDKVMAIIESFKRGERDREEFWLEMGGRFLHIEYRAIRGAKGDYLGTLELSQDLTKARALEGEKRLLSE